MYHSNDCGFFKCCLAFLLFILLILPLNQAHSAKNQDPCDRAWKLINNGIAVWDNSDRQIELFEEALALCPDLLEAKLRLGKVYSNRGELDKAAIKFQEIITDVMSNDYFMTRPGSKDVLHEAMLSLAEVYRLEGRLDDAEDQYSRTLLLFPHSQAAQNQIQYVKKRLHRYDNALPPRYNLLTNPTFTRISGFCLPKGKFLVDAQYRFWTQDGPITTDMLDNPEALFPPEERKVKIDLWIAGLRYGITDNLSIGVIGRYFRRKLKLPARTFTPPFPSAPSMNLDETNLKVSGIGDTIVMLKYQLWGKRQTRLSVYNLLSIPTGNEHAHDSDQSMTRTIPLGSGSFDNTPGLAFTTAFNSFITNVNISYRITDGENVGDEFNIGTALSYSYKHTVFTSLELAYRWRGKVRIKQEAENFTVTEKSTSTLFVAPGLQFIVSQGLKLEVGVKIPAIKPDKGWAEDYVFSAGISKAFF